MRTYIETLTGTETYRKKALENNDAKENCNNGNDDNNRNDNNDDSNDHNDNTDKPLLIILLMVKNKMIIK